MLKVIALVIIVLVIAFLLYVMTRPNTFRVQRSTVINAPPEKIFPLLNDFHSFGLWSPYEKLDPVMKRTYKGAVKGTGAIYEWEGNNKAGKGRMEITESMSPSRIAINLDFEKPFQAHNIIEFMLVPNGNSTEMTWAMHGPVPFMGKVIHVFMDMDRMVGKDFETGLANLKAIVEK